MDHVPVASGTGPLGGPAVTADATDASAEQDLAEIFRRHHAALVRLAVLLLRDLPAAEDVIQDVFARVQAKPGPRFEPGRELPYLRACVINGCRSVHRRNVVRHRVAAAWKLADSDLTQQSAEAEVIRAEERREVLAALAALPVRRREVLILRYYLGLSEAEIAATLGISQGTVKSSAARGIAAIARQIGEES